MHFLLGAFVAFITLVTGILFTNKFPKWFKLCLIPIGAISSGYALAILIRKIAIVTGLFTKPALYSTFAIMSVMMFVVIIATNYGLNKKKA